MVLIAWYEALENLLMERYQGWEGAEQFEGTGERFSKMLDELCWDPVRIELELGGCFKAIFEDKYNEMLVEGPITVWTLCPHHLLPCCFKVHVGYVPDGKVLGLSKFGRVAVILGKRPIMQEMYSRELADVLWEQLSPKGLGIYVIGRHGCMEARGILQSSDVSTSNLKGCFLEEPGVKEEFFNIVRGKKS